MPATPPRRILFVCLGNICRSPLAEGVFRHVAENRAVGSGFVIDSAGTGAWHVGSRPDPRSVAIASKHGIDISGQRARAVDPTDFEGFDLLLGMDRSNVETLLARSPAQLRDKIHLFLE
ncbi:MAG: low molecular weight phosphotyrosine protein phosphatase, partial [Myxococcales bacterium]|nr:low molecular weight phosphotyrosine protein phosphatase [Myxococcales bacterium]